MTRREVLMFYVRHDLLFYEVLIFYVRRDLDAEINSGNEGGPVVQSWVSTNPG